MSRQSFGHSSPGSDFTHPTHQDSSSISNEDRKQAGVMLTELVEPIAIHNHRRWIAFWVGAFLGAAFFWYQNWNEIFPIIDIYNLMLVVVTYALLAGGVGGVITWLFYTIFAGQTIRRKKVRLFKYAEKAVGGRVLAHIFNEHQAKTSHCRRIRRVIMYAFNEVNET